MARRSRGRSRIFEDRGTKGRLGDSSRGGFAAARVVDSRRLMVGLLVGGRLWQLTRDDAAERQEGLMASGLGGCLPEVRQGKAPRWVQWARGGTERARLCRMMILLGGPVSGDRGSSRPASGAPAR